MTKPDEEYLSGLRDVKIFNLSIKNKGNRISFNSGLLDYKYLMDLLLIAVFTYFIIIWSSILNKGSIILIGILTVVGLWRDLRTYNNIIFDIDAQKLIIINKNPVNWLSRLIFNKQKIIIDFSEIEGFKIDRMVLGPVMYYKYLISVKTKKRVFSTVDLRNMDDAERLKGIFKTLSQIQIDKRKKGYV